MWWQVVFWVLLIPLIIAEVIIFVKTKKLYWLIYALAIFTYVVAVSYTLDVFDAGRNAILLTLIVSAILMVLIGRHLGQTKKKKKNISRSSTILAISLAVFITLAFVVSVILGQAAESVDVVASISQDDIAVTIDETKPRVLDREGPVILTRTVSNSFVLPVPIVQKQYRVCARTDVGFMDMYVQHNYDRYPEVAPGESEEFHVRLQQTSLQEDETISELLIYESDEYTSCSDRGDPDFTIQVE